MSISFLFRSGADEETRKAACDFFYGLTGSMPDEIASLQEQDKRDIGGVDIVNWTLAIPGAIAALFELKRQLGTFLGRKEIRERIEPSFRRLKGGPPVILRISGRQIDMGQTTLDEILDALAEAELQETSEEK